jgi:hypothetical protein
MRRRLERDAAMTPRDELRPNISLTASDRRELIKDARRLLPVPARRRFLRGGVTLGSLAMLTGCDVTDSKTAESLLMRVSRFNDRVQGWLFDPNRLAPTYPESMITRPFPFNAFYGIEKVPHVDGAGFRLQVGGRVRQPGPGPSSSWRRCHSRSR